MWLCDIIFDSNGTILPPEGYLEYTARAIRAAGGLFIADEVQSGFYRTGDTAQFHDPADIGKGLKFAGRLAEDFKLATGTWVTAGRLRAEFLEAMAPLLADVLVCGEGYEYVAMLAWPKTPATPATLATELAARLASFNSNRGSSARVERLLLLSEPPSADQHEVSDKGTINQRVALARRAADVDQLYATPPGHDVVLPARSTV